MRPSYLTWAWVLTIACAGCGSPPPSETDAGGNAAGGGVDGGAADGGSVDGSATDAFVPSSALITVAAGGTVRSADGLYEIHVMPGALAADTTISIDLVAASAVPADIAGTTPLSAVYAVEPDGLTFGGDGAYEHFAFPTPPPELRPVGAPTTYASATTSARAATGGAISSAATPLTYFRADGSAHAIARLDHLSFHWVTPANRGLECQVDGDLHGGAHAVGTTWSATGTVQCVSTLQATISTLAPPSGPITPVRASGASTTSGANESVGLAVFFPDRVDETGYAATLEPSGPLAAGTPHALIPAPSWQCSNVGSSPIFADLLIWSDAASDSVLVELDDMASCVDAPTEAVAVVGDITPCHQTGGAVSCSGAVSAAINVIEADPATIAALEPVAPGAVVFDDVTFTTESGPATIDVDTGAGTGTATLDATAHQYHSSFDLSSGSVFDATATASWTSSNTGATSVSVGAPAAGTVTFGAPADMDTPVLVADGSCDALYTIVTANGCAGAGACGARVLTPLTDLPLAGGNRTATLVPVAVQGAFAAHGMTFESALVGCANWTPDTTFFPAGSALQVGAVRFVSITAAVASAPVAAGPDARACPPPTHTFGPLGAFDAPQVMVCISSTSCRVTNDLFTATPLATTQCASADRALRIGVSGTPYVYPQPGWTLTWASTPIVRQSLAPAFGANETAWIDSAADGRRYRVDFRVDTGSVTVAAAVPDSSLRPPYGAAYACDATPHTFTTSTSIDGWDIDARVCYVPPGLFAACSIHGDVESTPEAEACSGDYAIGFGIDPGTGTPIAVASLASLGDWIVESATAGVVASPQVTAIPLDTDVTFVVSLGTTRLSVVARWVSGGGVVVQSVTPL